MFCFPSPLDYFPHHLTPSNYNLLLNIYSMFTILTFESKIRFSIDCYIFFYNRKFTTVDQIFASPPCPPLLSSGTSFIIWFPNSKFPVAPLIPEVISTPRLGNPSFSDFRKMRYATNNPTFFASLPPYFLTSLLYCFTFLPCLSLRTQP